MRRPVIRPVIVVVLLGALVAAFAAQLASAGPAANERASATKLTLVAYSTPREAYAKLIPAFQKTAAGKDVSFSQSYGASGEQARAVINGLSADVIMLSPEPDVQTLVDGRPRRQGMEPAAATRDGHSLPGRLRRPRRQPEEDQAVGRPAQAGRRGDHPEPVHLGRRALEHPGAYGARRKREDGEAGAGLTSQAVPPRHRPGQVGGDSMQTFLAGKGDVLLAYENEARSRGRTDSTSST